MVDLDAELRRFFIMAPFLASAFDEGLALHW
jgi:hypothetical protein